MTEIFKSPDPLYEPRSIFASIRTVLGYRIDRQLEQVLSPSTRVIVLMGEGGLGKTTVMGYTERLLKKYYPTVSIERVLYDDALHVIEEQVGYPSDEWDQREIDKRAAFTALRNSIPPEERIEFEERMDEFISRRELVSRVIYGKTMHALGLPFHPEHVDDSYGKKTITSSKVVIIEVPGVGNVDRGREAVSWLFQSLHPTELQILAFIPHPEVLQLAGLVRETVERLPATEVVDFLLEQNFELDRFIRENRGNPLVGEHIKQLMRKSAQKKHIEGGTQAERARAHEYYELHKDRLLPFYNKLRFYNLSPPQEHTAKIKAIKCMSDIMSWIPFDWPKEYTVIPLMNYPSYFPVRLNLDLSGL